MIAIVNVTTLLLMYGFALAEAEGPLWQKAMALYLFAHNLTLILLGMKL